MAKLGRDSLTLDSHPVYTPKYPEIFLIVIAFSKLCTMGSGAFLLL
jgi:hypothetical protein